MTNDERRMRFGIGHLERRKAEWGCEWGMKITKFEWRMTNRKRGVGSGEFEAVFHDGARIWQRSVRELGGDWGGERAVGCWESGVFGRKRVISAKPRRKLTKLLWPNRRN